MEFKEILKDAIEKNLIIEIVISNRKTNIKYKKIDIHPIIIKEKLNYQISYYFDNKVEHENILKNKLYEKILTFIDLGFRQFMFFNKDADYQILINKKKKIKIIKNPATKEARELDHNRKKRYIIEDGIPCDFLVKLDIMNENGQVYKNKFNKFKQINRFLEFIEDILPELNYKKTINIVDFGCGKSYLTFALYYYLVKLQDLNVNIVGLDLKKDVIEHCNSIAKDIGYKDLSFIHEDINNFDYKDDIDMVVTLHACDIATDAAIVKAVKWNAKVILSVPCCQKEFRTAIDNKILNPMLKHGIVRENLSTLVTDSLRGNVLELLGYNVQLLEFIDMEHTQKNTLIRAINKNRKPTSMDLEQYNEFKKFWGLKDIFIERELANHNININGQIKNES